MPGRKPTVTTSPLKGQDVDGVVSQPRTGKGFTIGGRESKQAMGRASRAQSPSTQAIQDLSESLIRNRKNEWVTLPETGTG